MKKTHQNTQKTAVVVGATSGIGRACAEALLERGWRVALTGRRTALLEEICSAYPGGQAVWAGMDVTSDEAPEVLLRLLGRTGPPDLLLYAAGVGWRNRALDLDKELSCIRTNCEGMVRIADTFVKYVREHSSPECYSPSHRARLAVITSVAGTEGMGEAPGYSSTKKMQSTYLTALSQLSRMDKIPVRFTDIRPGFVKTDILDPSVEYPAIITARQAARHILRGLDRGRRVVVFDWRYAAVVALWRLIPRFVWERLTVVHH